MKTVLITGNAGQGKTTISANLATALALYNPEVLLVDADNLTPKMHHHFGIVQPQKTLKDLEKGMDIEEISYQHPSGLKVVFNTTHRQNKEIQSEKMTIIDTPGYDARLYNKGYPTILVTMPDFPSVLEVTKMAQIIPHVLGVIINKAENDGTEMSAANIQEFTGHNVLGVVPRDRMVKEALKEGYPVVDWEPQSKAATALKQISAKLMNGKHSTQ